MRNLVLIVLLGVTTLLIGCGKKVGTNTETTRYITQDFEGSYYFEHGGFVELVVSEDNQVSILREGYSLTSVNPLDQSLGQHPVIVKENLEPRDGKISFSLNVNYGTSSYYDIEQDVSGSNITGSKRTDYTFELLGDGKIKLTIEIYADTIGHNVNGVIAKRVLESD